jgi:hypothetical protein
MQRLIIAAFTALCIIGSCSLVMADEAIKGEMNTTMKSDMKGKKKAYKGKGKAKHNAAKGKAKAKAAAPPTAVPSAPVTEAAPAPAMGQ